MTTRYSGELRKTRGYFPRNALQLRKSRRYKLKPTPTIRTLQHPRKQNAAPLQPNCNWGFLHGENQPISSNARFFSSNRPRGYTCVGKRGIAEVYPRKYSIFKLRIGEVRVIKSKKRRLGLPPFRVVKKFPKLSFFMNMSAILFYRRREQWR